MAKQLWQMFNQFECIWSLTWQIENFINFMYRKVNKQKVEQNKRMSIDKLLSTTDEQFRKL